MIPHCFNRPPRTGQWVRAGMKRTANGVKPHWVWVSHRMSQGCKAWSTGDRATPAPLLGNWLCHGCKWLPEEAKPWLWRCFSREIKPFVNPFEGSK